MSMLSTRTPAMRVNCRSTFVAHFGQARPATRIVARSCAIDSDEALPISELAPVVDEDSDAEGEFVGEDELVDAQAPRSAASPAIAPKRAVEASSDCIAFMEGCSECGDRHSSAIAGVKGVAEINARKPRERRVVGAQRWRGDRPYVVSTPLWSRIARPLQGP